MKKILLSLGALAMLVGTASAQEANVGLKMGIGWSQWTGEDIDQLKGYGSEDDLYSEDWGTGILFMGQLSDLEQYYKDRAADKLEVGDKVDYMVIYGNKLTTRQSFNAGFQINSEINDYFWLKHEFIFATKGFSYKGTVYSEEVTAADSSFDIFTGIYDGMDYTTEQTDKEIDLRYRSYHVDILPVSLAAHYEGLQLFVGPYVSVMLASNWVNATESKVTTPGTDDFNYITDDAGQTTISRSLSIIDYGYVAGFEYELPFGLNAGIRYMQGFGSVLETPEGESRTNAFNRDLRLSLGYTFGKDN